MRLIYLDPALADIEGILDFISSSPAPSNLFLFSAWIRVIRAIPCSLSVSSRERLR